jgi:hypothetical protein
MTEERFLQLVGAYGADPSRWPADERAAASAYLAANPELVAACVTAEAELDALLARTALRRRIVSAAASPSAARGVWRWLIGAGLGLGFAGSAVAGVAAGLTLTPAKVASFVAHQTAGAARPEPSPLADPVGDAFGS